MHAQLREIGAPWEISKGFDNSASVGEFIPVAEAGDVNDLSFHLTLNDQTVQDDNTSEMIYSIDRIISYASKFFTLKTGDLIFTGTPSGVGRVAINDHLQGYVGGKKLLDFFIK